MFLPNELIIEIGLRVELPDLYNLSVVNRQFSLILAQDFFWQRKYQVDIGQPSQEVRNWREKYEESSGCTLIYGTEFISLTKRVVKASCGKSHLLFIDSGRRVWSLGENFYGQLGVTHCSRIQFSPVQIEGLRGKDVACGNKHSLIIDLKGRVWSFGNNSSGQLGFPEPSSCPVPIQIPDINAVSVSAGYNYTILIDNLGNVWGFGENLQGQLGIPKRGNYYKPVQIPNLKAISVATGCYHTIVISPDLSVWGFGGNEKGQLGLGKDDLIEIDTPTELLVPKAQAITAGKYHSIVLDLEGRVIVFGDNRHGQLGIKSKMKLFWVGEKYPVLVPQFKAKAVSAYGYKSMVLDTEGKIWVFGRTLLTRSSKGHIPQEIAGLRAGLISAGVRFSLIGKCFL